MLLKGESFFALYSGEMINDSFVLDSTAKLELV